MITEFNILLTDCNALLTMSICAERPNTILRDFNTVNTIQTDSNAMVTDTDLVLNILNTSACESLCSAYNKSTGASQKVLAFIVRNPPSIVPLLSRVLSFDFSGPKIRNPPRISE